MALLSMGLIALYCVGWVLPLILAAILWCRRRALRRYGVALGAIALIWFAVSPAAWFLHPPRTSLETPSPQGYGLVWLRHTWGNRTWVMWRDAAGHVSRMDAGPTRTVGPEHCAKPRVFVWLPSGRAFYVGRSYASQRGAVVKVPSGRQRGPRANEREWLLRHADLDEWERQASALSELP